MNTYLAFVCRVWWSFLVRSSIPYCHQSEMSKKPQLILKSVTYYYYVSTISPTKPRYAFVWPRNQPDWGHWSEWPHAEITIQKAWHGHFRYIFKRPTTTTRPKEVQSSLVHTICTWSHTCNEWPAGPLLCSHHIFRYHRNSNIAARSCITA